MSQTLKIAMAQLAPVWLNKYATLDKIYFAVEEAAKAKAQLIVFGEALLPGYPFWLALTGGAEWDTNLNKTLYTHYVNNAICIEEGDLDMMCQLAKKHQMAVYLGVVERPKDRGGHSIYATLVYINEFGIIKSTHRKLQPTYDERLTWGAGDGQGLQVHNLEAFRVGGLNCWENWMPLTRTALYGQGENLHIAVWPGSEHNTQDITPFIAKESRSFVVSVSAIMRKSDFPKATPFYDEIVKNAPEILANGGSCIAAPDGSWEVAPIINKEGLFYHTININKVLQERQNFDPVGHYSRPDVTKLIVNTTRQTLIELK